MRADDRDGAIGPHFDKVLNAVMCSRTGAQAGRRGGAMNFASRGEERSVAPRQRRPARMQWGRLYGVSHTHSFGLRIGGAGSCCDGTADAPRVIVITNVRDEDGTSGPGTEQVALRHHSASTSRRERSWRADGAPLGSGDSAIESQATICTSSRARRSAPTAAWA